MSERKRRRRIAGDVKYKRDDKRTETRGLTELVRRGGRKEYKEDRFSWQLTGRARSARGKEANPDGGRKSERERALARERERKRR